MRGSLALLEAGASWDPASVRMAALPADGGFKLQGKKLFVPDAAVSDFLICAVRMSDDLALVAVDAAAEGVTIQCMPALDGTRRLCAVEFRRVAVNGGDVLATGECARAALERTLDIGTAGLLMEMVGGMQRMLEMAVEYAKTRKQFGKPIGQFQAVQHLCADMFLLTESSRSAAYAAVWAIGENDPTAHRAVSVAKVYAGDAYREVGNRAIQVHGGMGFTWENDLHLYYRRAKAAESLFGDAVYHRERIARDVVDGKQPRA
jgi:alkylation response protein AidB-like acyl-CoA dehydrogenase